MTRPITVISKTYIGSGSYRTDQRGPATFLQFGLELWEQEGQSVNYTVAIVEFPDGHVEKVPAEYIRFTDKEQP